jgi:tripartite-type tricarboxylate transporter receptor subunit TctC
MRDFVSIGLISTGPYLLVTHPSVAARTVGELIALAKDQPGKLTYGSTGNGSTNHMAMELFKRMASIDIRHVPFKAGLQATTELVGGHVNMSMRAIAPLLPYVKTQRVRVLAVTSAKRASQLPQVPTVDESGLKGFEANNWFGMLAPAGTPSPIVTRVAAALHDVIHRPDIRAQLQQLGAEPADGNPARLDQVMRRELDVYGKLSNVARIRSNSAP